MELNEDDSTSSVILTMIKATEESNKEFSAMELTMQAPHLGGDLVQQVNPVQQQVELQLENQFDPVQQIDDIQQVEPVQQVDQAKQQDGPIQQVDLVLQVDIVPQDNEVHQQDEAHQQDDEVHQQDDEVHQQDDEVHQQDEPAHQLQDVDEALKSSLHHPDVFEMLYETTTVANVSFLKGSSGESRREQVERLRQEKQREEEEALTFQPKVNHKSSKKLGGGVPHPPKGAYVDKELTFSPQISELGRQYVQRRSSKESAEQQNPRGAGRPRDCPTTPPFTPEITKLAKNLSSGDKLKAGQRLYERSKSRELERQTSAPRRTKEDEECTFSPVFESKSKFTRSSSKTGASIATASATSTKPSSSTKPITTRRSTSSMSSSSSSSPTKPAPTKASPTKARASSPSKPYITKSALASPASAGGSRSNSTSSDADDCGEAHKSGGYVTRRRVLVVGSSNMDLISYVHEHPPIGATITGTSFEKKYGGKGANQAMMVARLCRPFVNASRRTSSLPSTSVAFLTKLGMDVYGQDYLSHLRAEVGLHAEEGLLRCAEAGTGVALITVDREGRNTIILQPGANLALQPGEVTDFIASQARFANVLVCQNEVSHGATLQALAEVSRIDHMVSIFNPAPISPIVEDMFELLRYADVICPNEVELSLLAGMPVTNEAEAVLAGRHVLAKCRNLRKLVHFMTRERTASSGDCVEECVQSAEQDTGAAARRPQVVVVTLGSQGACIVSDSGSEMIRAPVVQAVDTVGAGDCFIGTLSYHISNAVTLKQSVLYAVECASISVTRKGAQTSYPLRSELNYSYSVSSLGDVGALENLDLN